MVMSFNRSMSIWSKTSDTQLNREAQMPTTKNSLNDTLIEAVRIRLLIPTLLFDEAKRLVARGR